MDRACERFDELLMESADSGLPPALRAEFDAHLAACPACVERMKDYLVTIELALAARESDEDDFPPLEEPLFRRLLAARIAAASGREAGTA